MWLITVYNVLCHFFFFFFFNDTATTEIYTLSLHDALPISDLRRVRSRPPGRPAAPPPVVTVMIDGMARSEEHTSELQSQSNLVCRLLLEKKKKIKCHHHVEFPTYSPTRPLHANSPSARILA